MGQLSSGSNTTAPLAQTAGSGFRFWDDLNDDGRVQDAELGLVRDGTSSTLDFVVLRDGGGDLFLTPAGAPLSGETRATAGLTAVPRASRWRRRGWCKGRR